MRQAWAHTLSVEAEVNDGASAVAIDQVRPETPVDALPLSARARNALDRAGVSTVAELLLLPRNQLSVVRGVGTQVAREIVALADQLHARFALENRPYWCQGLRVRVCCSKTLRLLWTPRRWTDWSQRDSRPRSMRRWRRRRIEKLLGQRRADALRQRLVAMAAAEPSPGSMGEWARGVNRPRKRQRSKPPTARAGRARPQPDERPDTGLPATRSASEVAAAFGIDSAQIYASLQFLRNKRWVSNRQPLRCAKPCPPCWTR